MFSFVACHSTVLLDGGGTFKDFIKQKSTDVMSIRKFGKLGDISSSLKTVNVNDYGARGDGKTDDTQVHIFAKTKLMSHAYYH